jgi:tRNA (cytidine32/uridine32-2'-O)-methyltransferase
MDNIRIVMVRTYTAGNIGAASRAMKNMGLHQLMLVSPREFPSEEATKMATRGAEDVLQGARVVDSLYSAVHDCELVIACTARPRSYDLPVLSPEQAAERLYSTAYSNRRKIITSEKGGSPPPVSVALVFGPERAGLQNDDIKLAHYRVTIPTNPESPSLNLASAVQILSYELSKHHMFHDGTAVSDDDPLQVPNLSSSTNIRSSNIELPSIAKRESFYETLEQVLKDTGVAHKDDPRYLMQKMRRILDRAEPDDSELNLLRGALAIIQRRLSEKK